jgi:dihydrofolate reductase
MPVVMSKVRFKISMSLDGYVAGPNQSVDSPLGVGGMRLHEWVFPLKAFREMHGQSSPIIADAFKNVGASIMGRNMFGGHPGPWSSAKPWNGWWGSNPPFHHPVFVVTHHVREPLKLEGGNTFVFVTEGIKAALEQAHRASEGKDISLGGGAKVAQQFLKAGLVDEMLISLVPVLLGTGERLFEDVGDDLHGLRLVQTVAAPGVTHLKYSRP